MSSLLGCSRRLHFFLKENFLLLTSPFSTKSFRNEAASIAPASPGALLQLPRRWTRGPLALVHEQPGDCFFNEYSKTFLLVLFDIYTRYSWNKAWFKCAEKYPPSPKNTWEMLMSNLSNVYPVKKKKEDLLWGGGNLPRRCIGAPYSP